MRDQPLQNGRRFYIVAFMKILTLGWCYERPINGNLENILARRK
jgi:hypothetical protein